MPIENNSMSEFQRVLKLKLDRAEKAIENTMKYLGEMCVNEARENGTYIDQTGNLRSSIGYVVVNNGKIISKNIKAADKGTDKSTGVRNAEQFVTELAGKYNNGIILIVVAGMNYALEVEARKNVLASAELMAERAAPRLLQELGFIKAI